MQAVIGLGNPGKKYVYSRHNVGFIIVDHFLSKYKIPFKQGKGDYYYAEVLDNDRRFLIAKPSTYMNRSGSAVFQILKYFPLTIEDLLIVYDDFNLPLGTIRFRPGGSDVGHNGIKSIIYYLESEEFSRLKFGIGDSFEDSYSFVLSSFNKSELNIVEKLKDYATDGIRCWLTEGIESTMNKFNRMYL